MAEKKTEVTVFNPSMNTIEAAGYFWVGRKTTTRKIEESAVKRLSSHPLLEVKTSPSPELSSTPKGEGDG